MKRIILLVAPVIMATIMVLMVVKAVVGQEPDSGSPALEPTAEPVGLQAAGDISTLAQPPASMNYQGYLTDSSGTPLTGAYTLAFSLYISPTGSSPVWGPEAHSNVQVNKGLFSVVLGETSALNPGIFKDALFLEVSVDGAVLSTRQPLRPVAYAFSLAPGALIEGFPSDTFGGRSYNLIVNNNRNVVDQAGIYANGTRYGLRAKGGNLPNVEDDIAIYADDFVDAQGYISRSPSYWWVPGMSGVPESGLTLSPSLTGTAVLSNSSVGSTNFYLPVSLPSVLFGQQVIVKEMTLYYSVSGGGSIQSVRLEKLTGVAASDTLINSVTPLSSTTATSVTLATTSAYTLTSTAGALNLGLGLNFNNTSDTISIGGIRLKLAHDDGQLIEN